MFQDVELSIVFMIAEFALGGLIAGVAASLARRGRPSVRLVTLATIFGGLCFLLTAALAGWAGAHAAFHNGIRSPVGPGGEDLRLRNWVANHAAAL
jgi:hypothetical protein